MTLASNSQTDKLTATTTELLVAKQEVRQLQESLRKIKREREITERSLELERNNSKEVQDILTSMRHTLESSTAQIETLHSQLLCKSSALQEREKEVEMLQCELKGFKKDYRTATTSCQAMQIEVEEIQQTLLTKTAQLEEECKRRSIMEANVVELSQKLSDAHTELKEKESVLQGEQTLGAHVSSELDTLRIKSTSLEKTVASKELALQEQARELMRIHEEKKEVMSRLSEMEEHLHRSVDSKDAVVREVTTKVSEMEVKNLKLQQVRVCFAHPVSCFISSSFMQLLAEARDEQKALQLMQQAIRSSAELETERSKTLECELASMQEVMQTLKVKIKKQEEELAEASITRNQVVSSAQTMNNNNFCLLITCQATLLYNMIMY